VMCAFADVRVKSAKCLADADVSLPNELLIWLASKTIGVRGDYFG